jgi:hypothetical protein
VTNEKLKKRLKETQFVVEATSNEMYMFWEKFSDEAMYKNPNSNKFKFEQLNPGVAETIGYLDGRPVCISMFWYKIDGVMIMFWDCTSQVADHAMIEKWLKDNCAPRWDKGTRLAHTDSSNFHHALDHVQEVNGKKLSDAEERERQEALAVLDRLAQEREKVPISKTRSRRRYV